MKTQTQLVGYNPSFEPITSGN